MTSWTGRRAQVVGVLLTLVLLGAEAQDWPSALRLPLALAVFFVVPGFALVRALRIRLDGLMQACLILGLSLSADLIFARVLLALHVATVRNMLLSLGGIALVCLLASMTASRADADGAP
jgi:hypothetical protein